MRFRLAILTLLAACALASPAAAQAQSLSVSDATVTEGNDGSPTANFTVTLEPTPVPVSFDYATADDTASQPADYTSTSGSHTFLVSLIDQTFPVSVPINPDTADELNETFKLNLSNAPLATITDGEGIGTITNDDDPPSLTIGNPIVPEGSSGTTNAVFLVSLSTASGKTITLDYATQDGSAEQPGDYTETSDPLTFDPGETQKTVPVPVIPDTVDEPDESFKLLPSNPQNVTVAVGEEGVATITDDDLPPIVDLPPIARVDVTPQQAFVGKVVEFNGSRSSDPEGGIANYKWDLDGDGVFETDTGTESALGIAFFGPGRQIVRLRVTDSGGMSDDETSFADIFPAPPGAARDTTPPSTNIFPVRRSLRLALRRGIRVRFGCSEACLIAGSVGVDRRTGRRIGLRGRNRTMGRAFSATTNAGSKVLTLKLSRKARRALSKVKTVRVNLRFAVRDPAFNVRVTNHRITLRR